MLLKCARDSGNPAKGAENTDLPGAVQLVTSPTGIPLAWFFERDCSPIFSLFLGEHPLPLPNVILPCD